jgi:hypothetical protein
MDLTLLIVFAAAVLLPCVALWVADQRARRESS